jgi:hypothetical protein
VIAGLDYMFFDIKENNNMNYTNQEFIDAYIFLLNKSQKEQKMKIEFLFSGDYGGGIRKKKI